MIAFRSLLIAALIAAAGPVPAAVVTVSMVTEETGSISSLTGREAAWQSPFGGWTAIVWPFSIRVADTPIFDYRTFQNRLMDAALNESVEPGSREADSAAKELLQDFISEIDGDAETLEPGDPGIFQFTRRTSRRLMLNTGTHTIEPFGIVFALDESGKLSSGDPRIRLDQAASLIEIVLHPVTFRTIMEGRTVPAPLIPLCRKVNLISGISDMLAEMEEKSAGLPNPPGSRAFQRLTVFLPASPPDTPYLINNIPFAVASDGAVRLANSDERRASVRENIISLNAEQRTEPESSETIGISWFNAASELPIRGGAESLSTGGSSNGSTFTRLPAAGAQLILGNQRLTLPAVGEPQAPRLVLWDAGRGHFRLVQSGNLWGRPDAAYRLTLSALTDDTPALPNELAVRLEPLCGGAPVAGWTLHAQPGGAYEGRLPAKPGLWRIVADAGSALDGQPLGLVWINSEAPHASVSIYADGNRGIVQRGTHLQALWIARRAPSKGSPGEWPIRLEGDGVNVEAGRISTSTGKNDGDAESGCLTLDTTALAPGFYTLRVESEGVIGYPFRFRIVQSEALSDYTLYSHIFSQARPYAGSPVRTYYGDGLGALGTDPGLVPFFQDADSAFDPALAGFANCANGPASERFNRPPAETLALMSLAGLGMKAMPRYPGMLHHEDWNPKHTLPEELARLRRRLALFSQSQADIPGFGGISLGWFASTTGYWEESPCLDGHQAKRNAAANEWIKDLVQPQVEAARNAGFSEPQLETLRNRAAQAARSSILPHAFSQYLADALLIQPGLTSHNALPSFWLGGGSSYPPYAYATLSHRDSVDYTDYGIAPWGNFRAPAFMAMGNPHRQPLHASYATAGRHSRIATAFGAAGRGLDGISMNLDGVHPRGEDLALLQILDRFGPWFSALEPLPDVAVYFNGWPNQKSVILHDLARLRRPGMLLAPEDVAAGRLDDYKVLFLAGVGEGEPDDIIAAFDKFERNGGVILKDDGCHNSLPGRSIGFTYDNTHVHNAWGLAYPNGEWEFAHLWQNFKELREDHLIKAFSGIPALPVTTPDSDVIISPLAGSESILCFVINQTLVPLEVSGKWRQHAVLPRTGELNVQSGWHIHDVLTGKPVSGESASSGSGIAVDFTRMEGALYLLTRREPAGMAIQVQRTAPDSVRLNAWLADEGREALPDPMPFTVALTGPDNAEIFRKHVALSPSLSLDVPIPAIASGQLTLSVSDLIKGHLAVISLDPAPASRLLAKNTADIVGGREHVEAFLKSRAGLVTILLDEGQADYEPAARRMAELLVRNGRDATIQHWDPADVQPLPLRWKPLEADARLAERVAAGEAMAWRVNLNPWVTPRDDNRKILFDDPRCGYPEYGPRLRIDRDIVLFGSTSNHHALGDLEPFLRRRVSDNYPAAGCFFINYLWSPFSGGFDGLYMGCRDPEGAAAAVEFLAGMKESPGAAPRGGAAAPVTVWSEERIQPEDMRTGRFGTRILDVAFAPGSNRMFVSVDSYGDSLFVLDKSGAVIERRAIQNRFGNNIWWRGSGRLRALDDTTLMMSLWQAEYRYSLEDGWLSRGVNPPTGLPGRSGVNVAASTLLEDSGNGRAFLGGARMMHALGPGGALMWRHDDALFRSSRSDMLYPRSLFPRAITTDGNTLLVSGFGIQTHAIRTADSPANASLFALDATTGERLWELDGVLLNSGRVIPLKDRFLVADDTGASYLLDARDGRKLAELPIVAEASWILSVPNHDELFVVENEHFDREGRAARAYFRPLDGSPDRQLPVSGRVIDAALARDGETVTISTDNGATLRFARDGRMLWRSETPSGGLVRLAPDGLTVMVGARDGILYWLQAADGSVVRTHDFNPANTTTGARFIEQSGSVGEVPSDSLLTAPRAAPEPSYLASLDPAKAPFGPNLIPREQALRVLHPAEPRAGDPAEPAYLGAAGPDTVFTINVQAGKTYLVELLATVADPEKAGPHARMEVTVTGQKRTKNLPYQARLPLDNYLARRRMAFRADESGEVRLALRAVEPEETENGKRKVLSYANSADSPAGLLIGDLVVAAMEFPGANLVYDGGPGSGKTPKGKMACQVKPWTGGDSTVRWRPYICDRAAMMLTDGVIAEQDTAWTTGAKGSAIEYAEARIAFSESWPIDAIVVFEDNTGPTVAGNATKEKTAPHYGIFARNARTGESVRVGYVADNRNLVNIFTVPDGEYNEVVYFWAGRNDAGAIDGPVRAAEIEVFTSEAATLELILDDVNLDGLPSLD